MDTRPGTTATPVAVPAAGDAFVLTISVPADDLMLGGRVTVVDARTGKVRWSAPPAGNLVGAGPDGVVTSPDGPSDDSDPIEVGYYPLA